MKNYIIGIVLALALVMGVVAFAETAEPATDSIPSVSEEAPNEGAASEAPSTEAEKADNNAALQEASEQNDGEWRRCSGMRKMQRFQ